MLESPPSTQLQTDDKKPTRESKISLDKDTDLPRHYDPSQDSQETKSSPSPSEVKLPALQSALQTYWLEQSLVSPLYGTWFVRAGESLVISDKSRQDQQEKTWALAQKNIVLEVKSKPKVDVSDDEITGKDLFTVPNASENPKRILIEENGPGHVCFYRAIARKISQGKLASRQYDYIFLIPLHQCLVKNAGSERGMAAHVAAFICQQLADSKDSIRAADIEELLSTKDSRTLLVLDRFEEIAPQLKDSEQPLFSILVALLNFTDLIVTTSRQQIPPKEYPFDRHLLYQGFTEEEMRPLIDNFAGPTETKEHDLWYGRWSGKNEFLRHALKQNSNLRQSAHLNFPLIWEIRDSLTAKFSARTSSSSSESTLTMTSVYQDIVMGFIKNAMQKKSLTPPSILYWENLSETYALVLLSLGAMAWYGIESEQSKVEPHQKDELKAWLILAGYTEEAIESAYLQAVELGILQACSGQKQISDLLMRSYYFISSTVRDFFAAYYLAHMLQTSEITAPFLDWIQQHKYEWRYADIMSFLAGLTIERGNDKALQAFWNELLSPPLNMTGMGHLPLMKHCLKEAHFDQRIVGLQQLKVEIRLEIEKEKKRPPETLRFWGTPPTPSDKKVKDKGLQYYFASISTLVNARNLQFINHRLAEQLILYPEILLQALKAVMFPTYESRMLKQHLLCNIAQPIGDVFLPSGEVVAMQSEIWGNLMSNPDLVQAAFNLVDYQHQDFVNRIGVWMLGGLGEKLDDHPLVISALLKKILNKDACSLRVAIWTLMRGGEKILARKEVRDALCRTLKESEGQNQGVIAMTIGLLTGLKTAFSYSDLYEAVIAATNHPNFLIQAQAIAALGTFEKNLPNHPRCLSIVLDGLTKDYSGIREASFTALSKLDAGQICKNDRILEGVLSAGKKEDNEANLRIFVQMLHGLSPRLIGHSEIIALLIKMVKKPLGFLHTQTCVVREALESLDILISDYRSDAFRELFEFLLKGIEQEFYFPFASAFFKRLAMTEVPPKLVLDPRVLSALVEAYHGKNKENHDVAVATWKALNLATLIQRYLNEEEERKRKWMQPDNVYLPILKCCIACQRPVLALDANGLTVLSGGRRQVIKLKTANLLETLIDAMDESKLRSVRISIESCVGKNTHYTGVKARVISSRPKSSTSRVGRKLKESAGTGSEEQKSKTNLLLEKESVSSSFVSASLVAPPKPVEKKSARPVVPPIPEFELTDLSSPAADCDEIPSATRVESNLPQPPVKKYSPTHFGLGSSASRSSSKDSSNNESGEKAVEMIDFGSPI